MIVIDSHEPEQAELLLSPVVGCIRDSLNEHGWADYKWESYSSLPSKREFVHVERKQWSEILSGMDKIEDQLRRHMANQPKAKLLLLIEGLVVPDAAGTVYLKATNKNNIWVKGYSSRIRLSQVYAWLYQVQEFVEVIQTPSYEGTCIALAAMYKGDQKEAHTTFQRHYKKMDFHPNPQIVQLMGLLPGIGEKRAQVLIERFITVYGVVTASPVELATVDGIGPKLSVSLLQRIGRIDV